jgi:filamentous hemagglutinin family protein
MHLTGKLNTHALHLPALVAILVSCVAVNCVAQIKTDGSLGHPAQILTGPNYIIPQSIGLLSGNNLFQSFQTFNIGTGQSATFTTTTPGIGNVISRVTGGTLSQINGMLSLAPVSGAPSFFFINPAGVTFGAGGSINVPGAFHLGTADYVKFPDGNLYASLNQTSTFSSVSPEAFGFLGTSRATIALNQGAKLVPTLGQTVSLVAGDIAINGGGAANTTGIDSAAGNVRIMAVGQAVQEIPFAGALPAGSGNVSFSDGGFVREQTIGGYTSGNVYISAGNISIDSGAYVSSDFNYQSAPVGTLVIAATGTLSITNGGEIGSYTASSSGAIAAGQIQITAGNIVINGQGAQGNQVTTGILDLDFAGGGTAGPMTITTPGNLSVTNGGQIYSGTYSSGNAGTVQINAGSVTIDGQGVQGNPVPTGIFSQALQGSTGGAGSVAINTPGNLSVVHG